MTVSFAVPGAPRGKARPRVVRNRYTGGSVCYTPDATVRYEELVRLRYTEAACGRTFDGAVAVVIDAGFPVPKSASKKCRAAMIEGAVRPTKAPDCDNIAKIVCDALNGVAYQDDRQVVSVHVSKRYVEGAGEIRVTLTRV